MTLLAVLEASWASTLCSTLCSDSASSPTSTVRNSMQPRPKLLIQPVTLRWVSTEASFVNILSLFHLLKQTACIYRPVATAIPSSFVPLSTASASAAK